MKRTRRTVILSLVMLSTFIISCESNQDKTIFNEENTEIKEDKTLSQEEQELIALVEKLLFAAGNSDFQTLDTHYSQTL